MLDLGEQEYNGKKENVTFDAKLVSAVNVSTQNAKVYYSEDANATNDSDSWVETVDDFSKIKSMSLLCNLYKIRI